MFQITTTQISTEPAMITTQLPTWCCHQDDDDLSYLDDQDDNDPEEQDYTEERLTDHREFHKPDDVMARDDPKDLDSVMAALPNIKDSDNKDEDDDVKKNEDEDEEEENE